MKRIKVILLFSFGIVLLNCASSSIIITGEVRPPIDQSEVKIYLDPPAKYETIGLVEASSEVSMSRQAAQDRVIDELKKRAAKAGANGILLISSESTRSVSTGIYSYGFFYSSSSDTLSSQGRAIYVVSE